MTKVDSAGNHQADSLLLEQKDNLEEMIQAIRHLTQTLSAA